MWVATGGMNIFVGVLAYADDLTLLAPSPSALRKLIAICKKSGSDLRLTFNPGKTQCIRFSRERQGGHGTAFQFCGKYIGCVEYVDHLRHIISYDLQNDLDIQRCKCDFIRRANGVLLRFGFCTPEVLTQLYLLYVILWVCTVESEQ